ncbi:MAG: Nif3-like dinuclear metal center hexameric protein [bacterium]
MKLQEICRFLEHKAPLRLQEDYDNSGLLVGDPAMEITGALLCLDVTPEVVDEAIGLGLNLIISHHPFIFKGLKKLVHGSAENTMISKAIKNDIAIYAIHTNLDNARNGLNGLLMRKLGVDRYSILAPRKNMLSKLVTFSPTGYAEKVKSALFAAGAGVIGNYDCCSYTLQGSGTFRASGDANPFVGNKEELHTEQEARIEVIVPDHLLPVVVEAMISAHPYEEVAYDIYPLSNAYPGAGAGVVGDLPVKLKVSEFLVHLKNSLGLKVLRHTKAARKQVKRVALCSGSGAFLIPDAIAAGADVFVTADLKYHDFFIGAGVILLADIGHYESEHLVKEWLYDALIEKFPNFACLKSQVNTNPIHYF